MSKECTLCGHKTKSIVFGYIRATEVLLVTSHQSAFYNIPSSIASICLAFYHIPHYLFSTLKPTPWTTWEMFEILDEGRSAQSIETCPNHAQIVLEPCISSTKRDINIRIDQLTGSVWLGVQAVDKDGKKIKETGFYNDGHITKGDYSSSWGTGVHVGKAGIGDIMTVSLADNNLVTFSIQCGDRVTTQVVNDFIDMNQQLFGFLQSSSIGNKVTIIEKD
eukprot:101662_1